MNIFALHDDPVVAAQMQCDKHIVKMCLETAQMLSTVAGGPYKPTHANHPCTIWARTNKSNFNWLVAHGIALCEEYTRRYGKRHKCQDIIEQISYDTPDDLLPDGERTPFAQCMPDQFRCDNAVLAYRHYYHSKPFVAWSSSRHPSWWDFDLAASLT